MPFAAEAPCAASMRYKSPHVSQNDIANAHPEEENQTRRTRASGRRVLATLSAAAAMRMRTILAENCEFVKKQFCKCLAPFELPQRTAAGAVVGAAAIPEDVATLDQLRLSASCVSCVAAREDTAAK